MAEVFRTLAAKRGLTLPAAIRVKTRPFGVILARHKSAPLDDLSRYMLKYSTNLTAEVLGLSASIKARYDVGNTADSAGMMTDWFLGSDISRQSNLIDHSGLSDQSRITVNALNSILRDGYADLSPLLKTIKLRNAQYQHAPIKGAAVVAKTGTLNFISALAGYLTTTNGRLLSFAILTADMAQHDAVPQDQRDRAPGARAWARQARIFQHMLLRDWAML